MGDSRVWHIPCFTPLPSESSEIELENSGHTRSLVLALLHKLSLGQRLERTEEGCREIFSADLIPGALDYSSLWGLCFVPDFCHVCLPFFYDSRPMLLHLDSLPHPVNALVFHLVTPVLCLISTLLVAVTLLSLTDILCVTGVIPGFLMISKAPCPGLSIKPGSNVWSYHLLKCLSPSRASLLTWPFISPCFSN